MSAASVTLPKDSPQFWLPVQIRGSESVALSVFLHCRTLPEQFSGFFQGIVTCIKGPLTLWSLIGKWRLDLSSELFCMLWTVEFSSVQSLSRVWLFGTPWIAACQASLSITNSQSSLKLTSIESIKSCLLLKVNYCHTQSIVPLSNHLLSGVVQSLSCVQFFATLWTAAR